METTIRRKAAGRCALLGLLFRIFRAFRGYKEPPSPSKGGERRFGHTCRSALAFFVVEGVENSRFRRTKTKKGLLNLEQPFCKCAREDSNLHVLIGHKALNLARLPISPRARDSKTCQC